jgi:hypothetical protein
MILAVRQGKWITLKLGADITVRMSEAEACALWHTLLDLLPPGCVCEKGDEDAKTNQR